MATLAARCTTLFPILLPRLSSVRLLHCFSTTTHHPQHHHHHFIFFSLPSYSSQFNTTPLHCSHFHTHPLTLDEPHFPPQPQHSNPTSTLQFYPEISHFFSWVSSIGYSSNSVDASEFVKGDLPLDFLRTANGCLSFARHHPDLLWCLTKEDVEVVVGNTSPVLFNDASTSSRKMKSFLGSGMNDVFDSDKPSSVDLMKFLLSYVGMTIVCPENIPINNRVETSVRKLFSELANSSRISMKSVTSPENQISEGYEQSPRPSGEKIEMKRGDWICQRCSFMNFAKNSECLECKEPRPKKYLTGKEWECPKCNFFNFGKNVACLRCDCKNPRMSSTSSPDFISDMSANHSKDNMERSAGMEEKQQSWFTKIKQLALSSDTVTDVADVDFPEIKVTRNLGMHQVSDIASHQTHDIHSNINAKISQGLEQPLGEKSSSRISNEVNDLLSAKSEEEFPEMMPVSEGGNRFVVSKKKDRSLMSPMYKRRLAMEQASNNNHVPFVPFPPGYFVRDKPEDQSESTNVPSNNSNTNLVHRSYNDVDQTINSSETKSYSGLAHSGENQSPRNNWRGKSLEGSAVKDPDPLDMSEEAKAERWFRRVSQIKDISELSQIPDEDFPSIMPMRKGVNRFVVSKRKTPLERRLTSSKYQRNRPVVSSDLVKEENDSS